MQFKLHNLGLLVHTVLQQSPFYLFFGFTSYLFIGVSAYWFIG